jgi:excisionase family DNA binding protein
MSAIQSGSQVADATTPTVEAPTIVHEQPVRMEQTTGTVAIAERSEYDSHMLAKTEGAAGLFEEAEIPQVEDFLPFLDQPKSQQEQPRPKVELSSPAEDAQQPLLNLTEGTGVPRPIKPSCEPQAKSFEARTGVEQLSSVKPAQAAETEPHSTKTSSVQPKSAAQQQPAKAAAEQRRESSFEEKWARVPSHLRALFEGEVEEVAQRSYKTFKESRADLIERLLDPTITLEDTARLLNVCPTTVRRYTNKGILKHFRTPGNQRRFKLSDVIAFLESRRSGRTSTRSGDSEGADQS